MKRKTVYMIRNSKTGLYSGPGIDSKWTRVGKAWSGLGALKTHKNINQIPEYITVVEFVEANMLGGNYPASELFDE